MNVSIEVDFSIANLFSPIVSGEPISQQTFFEQQERTKEQIDAEAEIRGKRVLYYMERAKKELPLFNEIPASWMDK